MRVAKGSTSVRRGDKEVGGREPEPPTASLFSAGEPEVYEEIRGEVLGRPFRRFEVQVYAARRLQAWGRWAPIGEDTPLGQALLEVRKVLGPFWLWVEGGRLYLAFPEKFFPREEAGLRRELGALEGLLWALGELHPEG